MNWIDSIYLFGLDDAHMVSAPTSDLCLSYWILLPCGQPICVPTCFCPIKDSWFPKPETVSETVSFEVPRRYVSVLTLTLIIPIILCWNLTSVYLYMWGASWRNWRYIFQHLTWTVLFWIIPGDFPQFSACLKVVEGVTMYHI